MELINAHKLCLPNIDDINDELYVSSFVHIGIVRLLWCILQAFGVS